MTEPDIILRCGMWAASVTAEFELKIGIIFAIEGPEVLIVDEVNEKGETFRSRRVHKDLLRPALWREIPRSRRASAKVAAALGYR